MGSAFRLLPLRENAKMRLIDRGMDMEIISGRDAGIFRGDEIEVPFAERKLWVAVLAQALEDWQVDRLNARHEAEHFLLRDKKDFFMVCTRAGVDASSFRTRLNRLQPEGPATGPAPLAA
jgi:hypothetical protein